MAVRYPLVVPSNNCNEKYQKDSAVGEGVIVMASVSGCIPNPNTKNANKIANKIS